MNNGMPLKCTKLPNLHYIITCFVQKQTIQNLFNSKREMSGKKKAEVLYIWEAATSECLMFMQNKWLI